jgi:tRNA(Ile)-lysidine synthase
VALLRSLVDLGYCKLIVCHFDHQLRGRSSRADACFVEKLTADSHLDFRLGSANVRALARKEKMSIETAAREARYSFFAKAAKRHRCHTIFLAHHADDLVETFLLNLFRGTGAAGLAAMHEVSVRRIDDVDLTIVRPWLPVWRAEIDRYVREHRLKFREDASNKNLTPLRNRIRHRVIPDLERLLGRNIRQNIWRTATITADEENWINSQLPDVSDVDLGVKKVLELPVAFQRRQILKWLRARNVADIGFEAVERVRSLLEPATRTAKTNLPKNRHVRRRAGKIFVE